MINQLTNLHFQHTPIKNHPILLTSTHSYSHQKHQNISSHNQKSQKAFLQQCKNIIIELNSELQKLVMANDQLTKDNTHKNNQYQFMRVKCIEHEEIIKKLNEKAFENEKIIHIMTLDLNFQKEKITEQKQLISRLEQNIQDQVGVIAELSTKKEQIREEKRAMEREIANYQRQCQEEMYSNKMKEINLNIAKIDETFEEYSVHLNKIMQGQRAEDEKVWTPQTHQQKYKRSLSTDHQHQSSSIFNTHTQRHPSKIVPKELSSTTNPQVGLQLKQIKVQIQKQYQKIEQKKQTFKKDHVSYTLNLLQKKIGKIMQKIEHRGEESSD